MDKAGRPLGVGGGWNGTEFAGGLPTFRRTRRRVRASGPLGRRVAVRRGTSVRAGGRRVSAGGGIGFAAVAAGEGPRAKGGGLFGGEKPLDATPGSGHCLGPSETLNKYLTTNPQTPLHLFTESPRIRFENPNIRTFTIGLNNVIDNGKSFLINDDTAGYTRLKVDKEGKIIGGGFWASGWVQSDQWIRWVPLSQPPITCDANTQGATYWKQGEGLYCCLNNQWQKCFGVQPPPPPGTYTLTVTKQGSGSGTVTSNDGNINCGSTCSATYQPNTQVTLTASPASGSTFGGWSGACSGTGSCALTMNSDKQVTATFNGGGGNPTGDLKVNGSDGPVNVTVGQTVTVSWSAIQNCQTTARWEQRSGGNIISGPYNASLSGGSASDTIKSGATSFTLTCDNPLATIDEVRVNIQAAQPPKITSFTSSCSTCHGQYTLSWTTQYADSCTLNGHNVPVNGSISDGVPVDQCTTDADCPGEKCVGLEETVTYTLSCTNSAGSDTKTLTVKERWNECRPSGGPKWP